MTTKQKRSHGENSGRMKPWGTKGASEYQKSEMVKTKSVNTTNMYEQQLTSLGDWTLVIHLPCLQSAKLALTCLPLASNNPFRLVKFVLDKWNKNIKSRIEASESQSLIYINFLGCIDMACHVQHHVHVLCRDGKQYFLQLAIYVFFHRNSKFQGANFLVFSIKFWDERGHFQF